MSRDKVMSIRILLVDDQALFREGLHTLLSVQPDLDVIGEAENGAVAVEMVAQHRPDVVLMDVRMPILDGVAATRQIQSNYPESRVIMLTTFDDDEYVFEGLRAGAVGYLLKDVTSEKLLEAIQAAARGNSFLQPAVAAKVVAEFARLKSTPAEISQPLIEPLSSRELEILAQIAAGQSNREIAHELFLAEGTVKNHVTNILGKLGVRDRTQAALKAQELKLLP
ncbi:MAG: response regulator transcription factor [Anaerolineales bacterium]|nr:response regulator transcription factor [Anaerolineales bacterium]MCB0005963.1 response regulator transcription factor [Anaerolineales bacterium]MCB0011997.1 response regulator transcription factor [Anaerolineales bacterium]MCB0016279.1 response regulator transcription factor [Anaerolineales bacterium]MCB8963108.1 response regulator transcription factor [Ardenticatenales bacterium]